MSVQQTTLQAVHQRVPAIQVHNVEAIYSQDYPRTTRVLTPTLVLNAVSGVGRSTVGKIVQQQLGGKVGLLRNYTTRSPRNEDESDRLIFGSRADFTSRRLAGDVLFYVHWAGNGHRYALLNSELTRMVEFNLALFETTHFGWPLKAQNPGLVTNIWLTCSDLGALRNRLAGRGTESPEEQEQRFRSAADEQAFILARKDELIRQGKVDAVIDAEISSPDEVAHQVVSAVMAKTAAVHSYSIM